MGVLLALGVVSGASSGGIISAEGLLTSRSESMLSRGSSGEGAGVATLAAGVASAEVVAICDSSWATTMGGAGRKLSTG